MTFRTIVMVVCGLAIIVPSVEAGAADAVLANGKAISPLAARGASVQTLNPHNPRYPDFFAANAVTTALSPDGRTLLVLTSGFNGRADAEGKPDPAVSGEYVFVFDVSAGAPVQKQALMLPVSYSGIAFAPDGAGFFVSGGGEDTLRRFAVKDGQWQPAGEPLPLGHKFGNGLAPDSKISPAGAAGIAVTADSGTVVVANMQNDTISLVDAAAWRIKDEIDLRPGKNDPAKSGVAGGEYPYWVVVEGSSTAFVSSLRDREIDVLDLTAKPVITARIPVPGSPNRMVLSHDGTRLYVAADNSDVVIVIDTVARRVLKTISATAPAGLVAGPIPKGSIPNSLALSPDESRLYVTDGGINAVAVLALDGIDRTIGLIPTGAYPDSVSVNADGRTLYVTDAEGPPGPNPKNCVKTGEGRPKSAGCTAIRPRTGNNYVLQLAHAELLSLPTPDATELDSLTRIVATDNHFSEEMTQVDRATMAALRRQIRHVIYIVKENRTYDQVLGDFASGNGDPALAQFPADITPNQHAIAKNFVDLDNFYDAGAVSGDGWLWSTSARTTDFVEKYVPVNYAGRGGTYDSEGVTRNVNMGLATAAERKAANPMASDDPDILPGAHSVAAPDGPNDKEDGGYLWNAVLEARLSLRNYGFFVDLSRYEDWAGKAALPLERDPSAKTLRVAFPANRALARVTDPYFRGFDNKFPDYYRYREWGREFDAYVAHGNLPRLELVRFMHDHMGDFKAAVDGVDTPETQQADNDYAVGLVLEKLAASPYAKDTLVFVVEDDAQDGPDHVDAHRSIAFVVGPFIKQSAVISTRYSTVNLLRTIEEILGLKPLNLNDAHARPMTDIFDLKQANWSFMAKPADIPRTTKLPLPASKSASAPPLPAHNAAWWAQQTKGMDFSVEDRVDPDRFNRILWAGLMGGRPYPETRGLADPRHFRAAPD